MKMEELKDVLERHLHWVRGDCEGWENMRADLSEVNLYGTDLTEADLTRANLTGVDLTEADLTKAWLTRANLYGADLYRADLTGSILIGANLYGANLTGADLTGANLTGANLCGAELIEADLTGANLTKANLIGADLTGAIIDDGLINRLYPICCPEYGAFIGWKKANNYIVKLQITEDAKRSSAFGRKCRCNKAYVLGIENIDGTDCNLKEIASEYDDDFIYKIGATVEVNDFDENRTHECAAGIHFFITRQEAVDCDVYDDDETNGWLI